MGDKFRIVKVAVNNSTISIVNGDKSDIDKLINEV